MRMRAALVLVWIAAVTVGSLTAPAAMAGAPGPHVKFAVEGGYACGSQAVLRTLGALADDLEAYATDPSLPADSPQTYTFAIWATDAPAQITTVTDESFLGAAGHAQVPDAALADGHTYRWQVRTSDQTGTSPWSPECSFRYDSSAPSTPAVSSPNYPQGQWGPVGRLARFAFDGQGDPDVIGFRYEWNDESVPGCSYDGPHGTLRCPDFLHQPDVALATKPGGTASVLLAPPGDFFQQLLVESIDRAGNISAAQTYQIMVAPAGPSVTTVGNACGSTVTVQFAPHKGVRHVVSYSYTVDVSGEPQTVAADAQGRARVSLPLSDGDHSVQVRSLSASGFVSSQTFSDVRPSVQVSSNEYPEGQSGGGVGVTGTFTFFAPDGFDTSAFHYAFSDGTVGTVDPNTAQVQWTPQSTGDASVVVVARSADGAKTCPTTYDFTVAG